MLRKESSSGENLGHVFKEPSEGPGAVTQARNDAQGVRPTMEMELWVSGT